VIRVTVKAILSCLALVGTTGQVFSQGTWLNNNYYTELVVSGLQNPIGFIFINQDNVLILEKNSGKVKYVSNGLILGDALDLPVANTNELGLLGGCLHPDFPMVPYLYLYYSRANVDGGEWLGDRVARFEWNNKQLLFESVIYDFPFDPNQNNANYHHGGKLKIGPDRKLYISTGDTNRGYGNGRIEQNTSSTQIAGSGGIYRLELDGTIPTNNPFFYHQDPRVRALFAYGIRNCFGMSFDPITNELWITDNGPELYDEINILQSGANGGWLLIMGPDYRDAQYQKNDFTSYDADDLVYLNSAYYMDPVFSWADSIGISAIEFLSSDRFAPKDQHCLVVADVNRSQIYFHQLNTNRDGLMLTNSTNDRVADSFAELDEFRIGTTWGLTSDMQIGLDGYLYHTGLLSGRLSRIRPVLESFQVTRGAHLSGIFADIIASDDLKLTISPRPPFLVTDPNIQLLVTGKSKTEFTTRITATFELSCNGAPSSNIIQRVELFDWQTSVWVALDERNPNSQDQIIQIEITNSPNRFIQQETKFMSARISWFDLGVIFPNYSASVDRVHFLVTP
jgi:glucose/arabinose dehydrogenase